jgi:hypothetical protein
MAVRVTLNDLARLTALADDSHWVEADRWDQIGEDLLRLRRMAIAARETQIRLQC